MDNLTSHIFYIISVPTYLEKHFTLYTKVPNGEIGVKLYIPGKNHFITQNITSNITLNNFYPRNLNKPKPLSLPHLPNQYATYFLDGNACCNISLTKYFISDEKYLNHFLNLSYEKDSNVFSFKTTDITPLSLINHIENQFFELVSKKIKDGFIIEQDSDIPIITNLSHGFNTKFLSTFKKAFNKSKLMLNSHNAEYPFTLNFMRFDESDIKDLHNVLLEKDLDFIHGSLKRTLPINHTNKDISKI